MRIGIFRSGFAMDTITAPVTEEIVTALVDNFYREVRADDRLGPIFDAAIADWDQHLQIMRDFWSSVLLGTERYRGCVMSPHFRLPIAGADFDCWLALFRPVAQVVLPPEAALKAITIGERVTAMLHQGMMRMQQAATQS